MFNSDLSALVHTNIIESIIKRLKRLAMGIFFKPCVNWKNFKFQSISTEPSPYQATKSSSVDSFHSWKGTKVIL